MNPFFLHHVGFQESILYAFDLTLFWSYPILSCLSNLSMNQSINHATNQLINSTNQSINKKQINSSINQSIDLFIYLSFFLFFFLLLSFSIMLYHVLSYSIILDLYFSWCKYPIKKTGYTRRPSHHTHPTVLWLVGNQRKLFYCSSPCGEGTLLG